MEIQKYSTFARSTALWAFTMFAFWLATFASALARSD